MTTARDKLDDMISKGITLDIYQAEEVIALEEIIGENADQINNHKFGSFFGSFQIILGRYLILSVTKIYEPSNRRYQLRSIPSAIDLLTLSCDELTIEQRPRLIRKMVTMGYDEAELSKLSDSEITKIIINYFRNKLPDSDYHSVGNCALSQALNSLKTARDKNIAHNEAINISDIPKATYAEIDNLIDLAKEFTSLVGDAYLSIIYESDDGYSFLSSDAKRSYRSLKRLLVKADIIKET